MVALQRDHAFGQRLCLSVSVDDNAGHVNRVFHLQNVARFASTTEIKALATFGMSPAMSASGRRQSLAIRPTWGAKETWA